MTMESLLSNSCSPLTLPSPLPFPSRSLLLSCTNPSFSSSSSPLSCKHSSWLKLPEAGPSFLPSRRSNRETFPARASQSATGLELAIDGLQKQYGCEGIKVEEGEGGLTKVVLSTGNGSEAQIYLFGACVTSWKVSPDKDMLYVRPDSAFNGQKPISGGIPHCFPQFGPGAMQQHGFARNVAWSIYSSENVAGSPSVTFELEDNDYSRGMWDHKFVAKYKVLLDPSRLLTELVIKNTDGKPLSFTTALHTYFRASVAEASVNGLRGCKTLSKDPDPQNPIPGIEEREAVTFPGFVDRIYLDAPQELVLSNGFGDAISICNKNWPDAVLWNPHLLMPSSYKEFVCVENAKLEKTTLLPDEHWTAQQILSIV